MATTVQDLCVNALQDSGAFGRGMPPPQDAINSTLSRLNYMIALWRRKRWMVYRIQEFSIAATGAQFYTVGPGGDMTVSVRPQYLAYAFQRQIASAGGQPVDYGLKVIDAREDWAKIRLKSLGNFSNCVFYDPVTPLGQVYTWPVMPAPYQLFIGAAMVLDKYAAVTDLVALPEEYEGCIYYNLVVRTAAAYRIPADPVFVGLAKDAMNVLRQGNSRIAVLDMPAVLTRSGGKYNIFSDNN